MRYLLLAIVLTGCWPDDENLVFDERFEDGWQTRWSGDTGLVGTTETVFPGEQGAYFGGVAEIWTPIAVSIYDQYSDGLWLEYTTNCTGEPLVTGSSYAVWLDLPVASTDLDPTGAWNRVHLNVPVTAPATLSTLYVSTAGTPSTACWIDNLRIVMPAVDYAY